jgi:hypothetical protein
MSTRHGALWLLGLSCCATLGGSGLGDVGLPTSGVGPFRKLLTAEVRGVAPYVLDASGALYREPSALPVNPADPSSSDAYLYAVASVAAAPGATPHDVVVRTRADDARSFYGNGLDTGHAPQVVLSADAGWEGPNLAGPSAVVIGGQVFLYYAAAGGIGLAIASDGLTFQKQGAPVLVPDPTVAWETSTPAAPSVAVYPDGQIRMLYAAGASIGEADSDDGGLTWHRLDGDPTTPVMDPVLGPGPAAAPGTLEDGEPPPFDTGQVGDPCLLPRMTVTGRIQVRVLYAGFDGPPGMTGRPSAIGFAARYGDSGPLTRQSSPVLSLGLHEAAPTLFEWAGDSMLYVQLDEKNGMPPYTAIGGAFAPAQLMLGLPAPYASSP